MNRIVLEFDGSVECWNDANQYWERAVPKEKNPLRARVAQWVSLVLWGFIVVVLILTKSFHPWTALGTLLFCFFVGLSAALRVAQSLRAVREASKALFVRKKRFEFSDEAVTERTELSSTTIDWRAVKGIEETPKQVVVVFGPGRGLFIPKTALADPGAFMEQLRRKIGAI